MTLDYSERAVLITGASSGIGRRVALDFAAKRAKLSLLARRTDRLEEVAAACRERGAEVELISADLSHPETAPRAVECTLARYGRIDILVNNAGIPKHKQIYDVTPADVEITLRVNFLAPAQLTLAALPAMLRQGEGFIVNISSAAGRIPPPREAIYAASKFALTGFTEGLSVDLAGSNIHAAVIHVGAVDTEIWKHAAAEAPVRFRGKKHPPNLVADAVFECIEKKHFEMTVPRNLRFAFLFRALLPGIFRRGLTAFDPVPFDIIEQARNAAGEHRPRD